MISNGQNKTAANSPLPNGLVLAGGKSKRMGTDKGLMTWHGKQQRYYVAELLRSSCQEVFISCRAEQVDEIAPSYHALADAVKDAGPLAGIITAFKFQPDVAWLVVACDLPLIDERTISFLIQHRDSSAIATTFESPFDGHPEPLVTIWEPSSLPILQTYLADNFTCPRKALIRNIERVKVLQSPHPQALMNANTPEDARLAGEIIAQTHN